ncbi:DUF418 domain-containing protein [Viridibacillus sp. YIM B01967]|uniref:DUF418 domain-containing protein n=1 Tax=Viridibacillus soli TaxID=2798301 RepID=A0ABS1HBG2_9BACL|nr:DUF418 domain-containing protein [Viridibacillus soli]MBK3496323.1 DUF418 domain-containing protein [Viridibacillus soli]
MEQSKRIRLLDVLRGFAIIGTLGTNIWLFAQPGVLMSSGGWLDSFEAFLAALQSVFVNGKLLGLLTIMFGIGLELKYRKAQRNGLPWLPFYIWTMALLFLDGLLHYLFVFEYDILMSYALTGIIVAFLIRSREGVMNRWMKVSAIVHAIGVTIFSLLWMAVLRDESFIAEIAVGFREIEELYTEGGYWEQVAYRLLDFIGLRAEAIAILFMNIALYIVGIRLFRSGAFHANEEGRCIRRRLLRWGLGLGMPLNMLLLVPGGLFDLLVRYLFAPILSLGYIGLLAWMLEKAALSCYVLQNILASLLFYSWGFSLAPVHSVYAILATWIGISIVMMLAAHLFVKKIGTGPLEWLWRKLSYMPFKRRI